MQLVEQNPLALNATQWQQLLIVLSVLKLGRLGFGLNNFVVGALYSILIHGENVHTLFYYNKPWEYLVDQFNFGSLLVMAAIALGVLIIYFEAEKIFET